MLHTTQTEHYLSPPTQEIELFSHNTTRYEVFYPITTEDGFNTPLPRGKVHFHLQCTSLPKSFQGISSWREFYFETDDCKLQTQGYWLFLRLHPNGTEEWRLKQTREQPDDSLPGLQIKWFENDDVDKALSKIGITKSDCTFLVCDYDVTRIHDNYGHSYIDIVTDRGELSKSFAIHTFTFETNTTLTINDVKSIIEGQLNGSEPEPASSKLMTILLNSEWTRTALPASFQDMLLKHPHIPIKWWSSLPSWVPKLNLANYGAK
jgi:hypothetical protein